MNARSNSGTRRTSPSFRWFFSALSLLVLGLGAFAVSAVAQAPTPSAGRLEAEPPIDSSYYDPNTVTVGLPWTGEPGVTETVGQIMERERKSPAAKGIFAEAEGEEAGFSHLRPRAIGIHRHSPSPLASVAALPSISDLGKELLAPQTPSTSFQTMLLGTDTGAIPPDTIGDIGPTQILVAVNGRFKVFDKTGTLGGLNVSSSTFWASVSNGLGDSDPRVRYDRLSGRWFVTAFNLPATGTPTRMMIAVSSGSTITSQSNFTFFGFNIDAQPPTPNSDTNCHLDFDSLGVDRFALYIGGNIINSTNTTISGTTGFVVNKANLLLGTLTVTAFRQLTDFSVNDGPYAPQGVHNDDPAATEGYFIGVSSFSYGLLQLRRITNPGATPAISGNLAVPVGFDSLPVAQFQKGSSTTEWRLDVGDDRLREAGIHRNKITGQSHLWTSHNFGVDSTGAASLTPDRNAIAYYEIGSLTTTPAVVQQGGIFGGGGAASSVAGFVYPSVSMTGQGHAALGFTLAQFAADTSTAGFYPSVATNGRLRTDTAGTLNGTIAIPVTGTNRYLQNGGSSRNRWGDFSATWVDPTDDMTLWTFQEYCPTRNLYATRAVKLVAPLPATPASTAPSSVCTGLSSVSVTLTGTSTSGSEFFDPGPDTGGPGYPNHISASVTGGVTVDSVTFIPGTISTPSTQLTLSLNTTAATAGAKNITVTNPDGQTATGNNILTVVQSPSAPGASNNGPICAGATLQLSAGGAGPWNWTGPGGFSSSAQNPTIPNAQPANGGMYIVTQSNGSCASSASTTVVSVIATGGACGSQTSTMCDAPDTCGGGGACQSNLASAGTFCGVAGSACENQDTCNGAGSCTDNGFKSSSTSCAGTSQGGACDNDAADHCSGTSALCVDIFQAGATVCRSSAGQCDVAELCTGSSGACPADGFASSATGCTGASQGGACNNDAADHCTGTSNSCVDVFQSGATVCRAAAGQCDVAENCTGSSGACPADGFKSSSSGCTGAAQGAVCDNDAADHCTGTSNACVDAFKSSATVCRTSAGQCDVAETCTGSSSTCAADGFASSATACGGSSQGGGCDNDAADHCTGTSNACVDVFQSSATVCRASVGQCDAAETCSGVSAACPADVFKPSATGCTGASQGGVCDNDAADHCTGTSNACVDVFQSSATVCRTSAGQCDVAENCSGSSGICPADGFRSSATSCTGASQAGVCDNDAADHCAGTSSACVDAYRSSATQCRTSAGQCDVAETCTGTAGACPADGFKSSSSGCTGASQGGGCDNDAADHCTGTSNACVDVLQSSGTVCRASAGQCDVAETCTGSSNACPANGFASSATACAGASQGGACNNDAADHCTGTSSVCVDVFQASATVCRGAAGQCDVAENCTGSTGVCPADVFKSSSTSCTGASQGGVCDNDNADRCAGTSNVCVDAYKGNSTQCRAAAGQCDVVERCAGDSGACPADEFKSSSVACTGISQSGACDNDAADHCTGTSNVCVDVFQSSGTVCRASAGQCDVTETCSGGTGACPADVFQSSATSCTGASQGGACNNDAADHCSGTSNACVDVFKSGSTVCRVSAGQCDLAENCTGTSGVCPADGFQSSATICTGASQGGVCDNDAADHCAGTSSACVEAYKSSATQCRAPAGQCDAAETCTGSSGACPADVFKSSATSCTGASQGGVCDNDSADHCAGTSNACVDVFQSSATVCRSSTGQCDVAETCTGSSSACPADGFASSASACAGSSQGGACNNDAADHCTGTSNACVDVFQSGATVCRASAGQCDVAESCTGTSGVCPADMFKKVLSGCTGASQGGVCDNDAADHCTGTSNACVDVFQSSATVCRASVGQCDPVESCTGSSGVCPGDAFQPSATSCTGASQSGVCDNDAADHCAGTSSACVDAFKSSATICTGASQGGACNNDAADHCTGTSNVCVDVFRSSATSCTGASQGGVCDNDAADRCAGTSSACVDAFKSSATICTGASQGGVCDNDTADHCAGTSNTCVDAFKSSSTQCRASAGQCDMTETCTGSSGACPADGFKSSSSACTGVSQGGACDNDAADHCTGTSNACVDVFQSSATVCRAAAGQCDVAETCTGSSAVCPSNGFNPNGTACNDGNSCTGNDACTGGVCGGVPITAPTEVTNLIFTDRTTLAWDTAATAGPGTVHDVPRGNVIGGLPVGSGPEICLTPGGIAAATTTDLNTPGPGNAYWYLVRGRNTCGTGSYGTTSGGAPRIANACP